MVSNHILVFILLFEIVKSYYSVDLSNPVQLGNGTAISTIDFIRDQPFNNHFYVGFVDGMVRRLSSDLSSGTSNITVEQVDKFYNHYMVYNHTLANGTINSVSNFYVATVSHNQTVVRLYTVSNFSHFYSYVHNETIFFYTGNPISCGGAVDSVHLLAGKFTIRLVYKTYNKFIVNFTTDLGSGVICKSATLLDMKVSSTGDNLIITYYIHALTSNNYNRKFQITLTFTLNAVNATYDMSTPYVYAETQLVMPESIARMSKYNQMLVQQADTSGNIYAFNTTSSYSIQFDFTVPKDDIVSFFSVDGNNYILQKTQLILLTYSVSTNTYSFLYTLSTFPSSNFVQTFGTYFDLLLIPFTSTVYKSSRCSTQEWFDGMSCVAFTCTDPNCETCANIPNACTSCAVNYTVAINGSCSPIISNSTTNSTTNINQANTTNSTNSTNSANQTNSTNSTASSNSTNPFSSNASFNVFLGLLQATWSKQLYQTAKQTTMLTIAIPAARKILSPLFYYFSNFDDLFLYSFHHRTYGETIKYIFSEINQIEAKKWSIINYRTVVDLFGNSSAFDNFIGYQTQYLQALRILTSGESKDALSLIPSCTNFFIISAPITIIVFFALFFAFKLLFQFRVSQIIRKFDFVGFLFALLFEGNIQQFSFYLCYEWRQSFSFSLSTKLLKSSIVMFGFVVVCLSCGGYLFGYAIYKKLNKYLMDNNRNSLSGMIFLLIQNGLRNLILGMTHSLLRDASSEILLSSLCLIELVSFFIFIYSANNAEYQSVYSIWIYIFLTFIRLLLILTFFIDFNNVNWNMIENTQTGIIIVMILVYLGGIIVRIIGLIKETIIKISQLIGKKQKSQQQQMHSQIQKTFKQKKPLNNTMFKLQNCQFSKKPCGMKQREKIKPKNYTFRKDHRVYTLKNVQGGINQYKISKRFR